MSRYKKIVDQLPVGICLSDSRGRILAVNKAAIKLLEFDDERSLLATSLRDIYVDVAERDNLLAEIAIHGKATRVVTLASGTFQTSAVRFTNGHGDLILAAFWVA